MSRLQNRLDRIRENFESQAPADKLAVMHAATKELAASGIMDRIPKVGDQLPPFALPDSDGQTVSSADLLAQGPLVVSFYRGGW